VIIEYNEIGPAIGRKGIEPVQGGSGHGAIRYNFVHQAADHEMTISSDNWDVYGNLVWHQAHTSNTGCTACVPFVHEPNYGVKTTGNNNDLWNNVFIGELTTTNTETVGFGFSLPNMGSGGNGNRFVHNTIYKVIGTANFAESGVSLVMGVGGTITVNSLAENNILYESKNSQGNIQMHWNGATTPTFNFNDLWGGVSGTEAVVSCCGPSGPTAYSLSAFQGLGLTGVGTSNRQLDPVFTGGTLPTGMDSNFHPNTNFFTLTGSSPATVTTTNNPISGDATHGYSSASNKFATDIIGNARSNWSMGAYEFVAGCTPSQLAFTTPPVNSAIGANFSVRVEVQNASGTTCTSDTSTVTITNTVGTCAGLTLQGTTSGGSAGVFATTLDESASNLSTGISCTLTATNGTFTVVSNAFTISDITAPTPGNAGAITISNITTNSMTLTWARATDQDDTQATLLYEVCQSGSNNIAIVGTCEMATIVQAFATDIITVNATSLSPSTPYFFNVVVKDTAGIKNIYSTASATTLCVASQLLFSQQPSAVNILNPNFGARLGTVAVTIADSNGVPCAIATNTITVAKDSGATWGCLGPSGSLTQAPVNGVATFNNLFVGAAGGVGSIDATASPMLTPATSNSFTVRAPSLRFSQPVIGALGC
jgi:hypothetical protein